MKMSLLKNSRISELGIFCKCQEIRVVKKKLPAQFQQELPLMLLVMSEV